MAKQRIVNTKFWDDSYIAGLRPIEKLAFLYLLTNPLTNISGVYELPLKRAAFDVGVNANVLNASFSKLEQDGKIVRQGDWVGVVNFIRHQTLNPKVKQGIVLELAKAPEELKRSMGIDYRSLSVAYGSVANPNANLKRLAVECGWQRGELVG